MLCTWDGPEALIRITPSSSLWFEQAAGNAALATRTEGGGVALEAKGS